MEREEEKMKYLSDQFGYAGIDNVPEDKIRALVKDTSEAPVAEHTLFMDKDGKSVAEGQEYEDRLDIKLKCRHDVEKDFTFFNRYDCAILLKNNEEPLLTSAKVSYGNTYTPRELHKMVKDDTAIQRKFYNSDTKEWHERFAYADFRNTDNEGNILIRRKDINLDDVIMNSHLDGKESPHLRANMKERLWRGELAYGKVDMNGEKKDVLVKLNPQYKTLHYFEKESMKPLRPSFAQKSGQSANKDKAEKQGMDTEGEPVEKKVSRRKKKVGV